ncbi:Vacuolar protein sorting-associated protein 62 [Ascosphaera acerosa]|nr:Vacuolar protein sorting-associated protein 62 [Ascosphaera acerosa]
MKPPSPPPPPSPWSRASRALIAFLSCCIAYVCLNSLAHRLNPEWFIWFDEDREEAKWLASSPSWWDRKACRWLSLCGLAHFHAAAAASSWSSMHAHVLETDSFGSGAMQVGQGEEEEGDRPTIGRTRQQTIASDEKTLSPPRIPSYVFEHAPFVYLHSGEQYWPGDIAEHVAHTTPYLNYTPVPLDYQDLDLTTLAELNQWQKGQFVFLTSNDSIADHPDWLEGRHNIPEPMADADEGESALPAQGKGQQRLRHGQPGRSSAPVVLVVVDKGAGVVDAFWFYFYSFNLGNVVLRIRFGNHVGDWEHSLVRFRHGKPESIFFSAHSAGEAYSYDAVEKIGKRTLANTVLEPVIYSARGTHAMYATPGTHSYGLPWGLLHDVTDRGPLWDPTLNALAYTYNTTTDDLRASSYTPDAPLSWFYFAGHWGDKFYPLSDERQYRFGGQYHYVNGPLGPRFKHLDRASVCPVSDPETPCVIKHWIDDDGFGGEGSDELTIFTDNEGGHLTEPGDDFIRSRSRHGNAGALQSASHLGGTSEGEATQPARWSPSFHTTSANRDQPLDRRAPPRPRVRRWVGVGTGEEHSEADIARFLK